MTSKCQREVILVVLHFSWRCSGLLILPVIKLSRRRSLFNILNFVISLKSAVITSTRGYSGSVTFFMALFIDCRTRKSGGVVAFHLPKLNT